ncbi:hypothetical protein N7478_002473 [Penicillium angulare]|uniref:uncharacterized protein n=1 Tax=Penicillium angulare TaxID=116970 RepID=UPI002540F1DB|nr:uncharacterized protein N7478_002473 [Penicillium angulare]KAJ5286787.1 hypothetical protein N7478_002473 [Penicillium angulare]
MRGRSDPFNESYPGKSRAPGRYKATSSVFFPPPPSHTTTAHLLQYNQFFFPNHHTSSSKWVPTTPAAAVLLALALLALATAPNKQIAYDALLRESLGFLH